MSTVGVMTDVSRVQVVCESTYGLVPSQACPEVSPFSGGVDVERGGTDGGLSGPPPVPVVPAVPVVPVPGVVRVQAHLIHRVDCRRAIGALLAAAQRLRVVGVLFAV